MDKNVQVVVPENYDGKPIVVHMMEGKTPDPINMRGRIYEGDINAVAQYVARTFDKDDSIILIDGDKREIELIVMPNHPHQVSVTAKLLTTKVFDAFCIEKGNRFSVSSLKQLIRVNKMYFPDQTQHLNLLTALSKSEIAVSELLREENDSRGNTLNMHDVQVKTALPTAFTIEIPIFKGLPKTKFQVEICLEKREKAISVWLESAEALQIMQETWDDIIAEHRVVYADKGITVICK